MSEQTWKDEYAKRVFGIDTTYNKALKGLELKEKNIPKYLYKYRAINEFSIKNLEWEQLWFNSADKMNDPYDSSLKVNEEKVIERMFENTGLGKLLQSKVEEGRRRGFSEETVKEFVMLANVHLDKVRESFRLRYTLNKDKIPKTVQDKTFISCFSELNDSMLMWSHYTNNHQGFCMEYEFQNPETLETYPTVNDHLYPVIYSNKMVDLTEYAVHLLKDLRKTFDKRFTVKAATHKAVDWAYEKEWRLIMLEENQNAGFEMRFFNPNAIYLGTKISEPDKETIMSIAEKKEINVYQMKMDDKEFKLTAHPELLFSQELVDKHFNN